MDMPVSSWDMVGLTMTSPGMGLTRKRSSKSFVSEVMKEEGELSKNWHAQSKETVSRVVSKQNIFPPKWHDRCLCFILSSTTLTHVLAFVFLRLSHFRNNQVEMPRWARKILLLVTNHIYLFHSSFSMLGPGFSKRRVQIIFSATDRTGDRNEGGWWAWTRERTESHC